MGQNKSGSGSDKTADDPPEYTAYTVLAEDQGPAKWLMFRRNEVLSERGGWPPHLMFMKHASDINEMWVHSTEEFDQIEIKFRDRLIVRLVGGNFDKKGKYGISLIDGFWQQRVNGIYQLSRDNKYPPGEDPWIGAITLLY